jgi:hypothetical protein
MTTAYRLLGQYLRPIGQHLADGESVHASALDRLNLPACDYKPSNLSDYLQAVVKPATSDTARIPRGKACEELPS